MSIWLSVDPLASNFPHQTPYAFTDNNPINLVDPDGLSAVDPANHGMDGFEKSPNLDLNRTVIYANEGDTEPPKGPSGQMKRGDAPIPIGDGSTISPSSGGTIKIEDCESCPRYIGGAGNLQYIDGTGGLGLLASFKKASTLLRGLRSLFKKEVASVSANRLKHIFGKSEHALDDLVKQYGSQEKAFNAFQDAANQALKNG